MARRFAVVTVILAVATSALGIWTASAAVSYDYDGVATSAVSTVEADPAPAAELERWLKQAARRAVAQNYDDLSEFALASARPDIEVIAPSSAVRGGAGPVRQGAAGVERTVADLEAAGGRVLGREVTVEAAGVRTRPDLFVELPCGTRCFLEVKTGPGAALTPNQATAFPGIRTGGAIPRGANAAAAGLTPGVPIGPMPVWTIHQPWPLFGPL